LPLHPVVVVLDGADGCCFCFLVWWWWVLVIQWQSITRAKRKLGKDRAVPMLLGPITLIWLGQIHPSSSPDLFSRTLSQLLPLYSQLLDDIAGLGVKEVQFHEPAMITNDGVALIPHFQQVIEW